MDTKAGVLHVRKQLDRSGERVEPKTATAVRDVVLLPALAHLLREHRAASPFAKATDFVFSSSSGTALHYRNVVRRGLDKAMERAKLDRRGRPKLRWHDLRHTYASLLISEGFDVAFVSRQLGHASPSITLDVYSHMFDHARHADAARDALEARFRGAALG